MFRKPKRSAKASLRKRNRISRIEDDSNIHGTSNSNSSDEENNEVIKSSVKRNISEKRRKLPDNEVRTKKESQGSASLVHQFNSSNTTLPSAKDLATREAQYHPEVSQTKLQENKNEDVNGKKIYTGAKDESKPRNKFLAGPLKAPTFIRTTCRFDYQPDICKDYKETGFCGFGDTCIYLHDRGDTLSGWQLEKEWEERKKKDLEAKEKEMNRFIQSTSNKMGTRSDDNDEILPPKNTIDEDDGIPFACFICRGAFKEPVVTSCMHYFCEKCIIEAFKTNPACPICGKDTHGVFNFPTKLISKKKKIVGSRKGWDVFFKAMKNRLKEETD